MNYANCHYLYVPNKLVVGRFNKKEDKFSPNYTSLLFHEYGKVGPGYMESWQKNIDKGKMEIVQEIIIPDNTLEKIAELGRKKEAGVNTTLEISNIINSHYEAI